MVDLDKTLLDFDDAYRVLLEGVSAWLLEWLGGKDERPLSSPMTLTTIYSTKVIVRGVKSIPEEHEVVFVYDNDCNDEDFILLEEVSVWSLVYALSGHDWRKKHFG